MFKIIAIYVILLACSICSADDFQSVKLQVLATGATVNNDTLRHIVSACKAYRIPCKEFTAMLAQESMFRVSAYNAKTKDYGIGQVNIKTIVALKLDKTRLITDTQYSIYSSARVFQYFYKRYSAVESLWYCRYNVGTGNLARPKLRKACISYAAKVNLYLNNTLIVKD